MAIKLQTIGIVVNDMSVTLRFYRTLGLTIPEGLDGESNVEFTMENGITLGFLTMKTAMEADANFINPVGQSMNLQFECQSPQEVDDTYNKLVQSGYKSYSEPWDAFWGQRFARVMDPDKRIVNVYAEL